MLFSKIIRVGAALVMAAGQTNAVKATTTSLLPTITAELSKHKNVHFNRAVTITEIVGYGTTETPAVTSTKETGAIGTTLSTSTTMVANTTTGILPVQPKPATSAAGASTLADLTVPASVSSTSTTSKTTSQATSQATSQVTAQVATATPSGTLRSGGVHSIRASGSLALGAMVASLVSIALVFMLAT